MITLLLHLGVSLKGLNESKHAQNERSTKEENVIKLSFKKDNLERQIVNTVKSENKKPKENKKKYLSHSDNSFYRETKARNIDKFNIGAKGNSKITKIQKEKANRKENKIKNLKALTFNPFTQKMPEQPMKKQKLIQGSKFGQTNAKGLSANNDFLEKLPLSDFTKVNSQEFKFYGFYQRIRGSLETFWGMSLKEKADQIFRRGGRIPASENFMTNLEVVMNSKGEVVKIKVKGSSGVKELDDAAIDSFNSAGPFPNPPKEMLTKGFAKIMWGFVVKS